YQADGKAVSPQEKVELKGQVGDKVTVPTAPAVSGHHVDSITFNGTKVQAGSEVTLGETNELTYTYVKDEELKNLANETNGTVNTASKTADDTMDSHSQKVVETDAQNSLSGEFSKSSAGQSDLPQTGDEAEDMKAGLLGTLLVALGGFLGGSVEKRKNKSK
ncbi:LPXTG cell wall anchor domain-containing protein, partial [Ligilactobacillus faecis]